jgi:hypothetical protein
LLLVSILAADTAAAKSSIRGSGHALLCCVGLCSFRLNPEIHGESRGSVCARARYIARGSSASGGTSIVRRRGTLLKQEKPQ